MVMIRKVVLLHSYNDNEMHLFSIMSMVMIVNHLQ